MLEMLRYIVYHRGVTVGPHDGTFGKPLPQSQYTGAAKGVLILEKYQIISLNLILDYPAASLRLKMLP